MSAPTGHNIPELLSPINVRLEQLLLDPNNPRFAELGEGSSLVPECRFSEESVQRTAYERMKSSPRFDVAELRDTIRNLGFLPMDRIVVRKWKGEYGSDSFVVVEGNRRVTALRWLRDLNLSGKETLNPVQIDNFTNLQVLLLDSENAPENLRWILPGLRHVSGIKEWGPYQKARTVYELRNSGETQQSAAQSLGLSTRAANQLMRSYQSLEQMKADEEFGEYAKPELYSFFEEVFKRPDVKNWLEWDDNAGRFKNAERLREFYLWIVGDLSEAEDSRIRKLPEAKSIRDLGRVILDSRAFAVFKSHGGTLNKAISLIEVSAPIDWVPAIQEAASLLHALPAEAIKSLGSAEIEALDKLREQIDQVMRYQEALKNA